MGRDVIISNGFNRFHLSVAAAELDSRQRLKLLLTGAYPTRGAQGALRILHMSASEKGKRLLDRGESIESNRVRALSAPEAVYAAASALARLPIGRWAAPRLDRLSWRLYGKAAAVALASVVDRARVFHYRAGFGGASAAVARRHGLVLLCDHSIAHPAVIEALVEGNGVVPRASSKPISELWSQILTDIERADAVIVNSHFVMQTFLDQGWPADQLHVLYWGVDDRFMETLPPCRGRTRRLRLFFAGALQRRKGAHVLLEALRSLNDLDYVIEIAGPVDPDIAKRYSDVLAFPRVRYLQTLSRAELAGRLVTSDVFVFPSLAEGSARVVFEALAAGCYVITTPNAGSIVEDGVHGCLVPPGDPAAVARAIRAADADRTRIAKIGAENACLIRDHYTQRHYGDGLVKVYEKLLDGAKPTVRVPRITVEQ